MNDEICGKSNVGTLGISGVLGVSGFETLGATDVLGVTLVEGATLVGVEGEVVTQEVNNRSVVSNVILNFFIKPPIFLMLFQ